MVCTPPLPDELLVHILLDLDLPSILKCLQVTTLTLTFLDEWPQSVYIDIQTFQWLDH